MAKLFLSLDGARRGDPRAGREALRGFAARLRQGIDQEDAAILAEALERMADDDALSARNAFTAPGVTPKRARPAGVHRYYEIAGALGSFAWEKHRLELDAIPAAVKSEFLDACQTDPERPWIRGLDMTQLNRALKWRLDAEEAYRESLGD